MNVYKIRNVKTGLFAPPGRYSPWSDKGKIFARINHARGSWSGRSADCEIVEFALSEIARHPMVKGE